MRQRDNQWRQARLRDVTASRFADALTTPVAKGVFSIAGEKGAWHVVREGETITGDFTRQTDAKERQAELVAEWCKTHWSRTAHRYMVSLCGERMRNLPSDLLDVPATRWGNDWEQEAFAEALPLIEDIFGAKLSVPVGEYAYIRHPTEDGIGCSPDGIIGDDWLLELKCPYNFVNHDLTVALGTIPPEHIPQVQGSLWITGRKGYAFGSFDPRLRRAGRDPLFLCRVERDDDYIDNVLAPRVIAFRDWLRAEYDALVGGVQPF